MKNKLLPQTKQAAVMLTFLLALTLVSLALLASAGVVNLPEPVTKNTNPTTRDITWEVSLSFQETSGKVDSAWFGEAPEARDGPPHDDYDVVKPPMPMPPFLRTWLNDSLEPPYDVLWKDYRQYPDTEKIWKVFVWWTGSSATSVTMTWSTALLNASEYVHVVLKNTSGVQVSDMRTTSSFTFACPAYGLKTFTIECAADVYPPQIINHSPGTGETGDAFTFNASVFDDLTPAAALEVKVNWVHGSLSGNDTMIPVGGDYFEKTITLDNNAVGDLTYHFYAKDNAPIPNTNYTPASYATVTDDEAPQLTDTTTGPAYTGDPFTFTATATDNIGVSAVYIEYWYGTGTHTNTSMDPAGGDTYSKTITVQNTNDILSYIISAKDAAPNWINSGTQNVGAVIDNDAPLITDTTTGPAYTNNPFTFSATVTDNIGVTGAYVEYWFGAGSHTNTSMTPAGGDTYTKTINVPATTDILYYMIRASDNRPNWASTGQKDVGNVIDNNAPQITDTTTGPATTGDSFSFTATITDNIQVAAAYVEYWYGTGGHTNTSMTPAGGDTYTKTITVPDTTDILYYIIRAQDNQLNWASTGQKDVGNVIDDDAPSISADSGPQTVGTGNSITLWVQATDNIAVTTAKTTIDSIDHTMTWDPGQSRWEYLYTAPTNNVLPHTYTLTVYDAALNPDSSGPYTITVVDDDAPLITDTTTGPATTGDPFTFSATVTDNIGVIGVYVEYWFGAGSHTNISMTPSGGNTYQETITIPETTDILYYTIRASDNTPNWASTGQQNLGNVIDDDAPTITLDSGPVTVGTGDSITLWVQATDNIAVTTAKTTIDTTDHTMTYDPIDARWEYLYTAPTNNVLPHTYTLTVYDAALNPQSSGPYTITVIDDDEPTISADSGPQTVGTGNSITLWVQATDNIAVTTAKTTIDTTDHTMTYDPIDARWEYQYTAPTNNVLPHTYILTVYDAALNPDSSGPYTITVVDDDAPLITDTTTGPAYTNDPFVFSATVTDNIGVTGVYVEYWFGAGSHTNTSMTPAGGNTYQETITVPDTTDILYYIIRASDNRPNWASTGQQNLGNVIDDDAPLITDTTTGPATTGDPFTFSTTVTDNIGVTGVYVEYWYGTGGHTNTSMTPGAGNTYSKTITIPDTTDILYYIIRASDNRPNWASTGQQNLGNVIDDDAPTITLDSGPVTVGTGDSITLWVQATDNIGVTTAKVTVDVTEYTMTYDLFDARWEYQYTAPPASTLPHSYTLSVYDAALNPQSSGPYTITVVDNDPPVITNVQATPPAQLVNGYINITATITENINLLEQKVIITGPAGFTPKNDTMLPSGVSTYYYNDTYTITGLYQYHIWAKDTSNNAAISTTYQFEVYSELMLTTTQVGWNFISIPFNQSITRANLFIDYGGMQYTWAEAVTEGIVMDDIYDWNRFVQQYNSSTTTISPGRGYWVYTYHPCEIWATSLGPMVTNNYITALKQRWNVIGVPMNQPVSKVNLTVTYLGVEYNWTEAVNNGIVMKDLFGWTRSTPQAYHLADTLYPGYCYWVYAYHDCVLKHTL